MAIVRGQLRVASSSLGLLSSRNTEQVAISFAQTVWVPQTWSSATPCCLSTATELVSPWWLDFSISLGLWTRSGFLVLFVFLAEVLDTFYASLRPVLCHPWELWEPLLRLCAEGGEDWDRLHVFAGFFIELVVNLSISSSSCTIKNILSGHHSVDWNFQRRIVKAMEQWSYRQTPWKCRFCRRLSKAGCHLLWSMRKALGRGIGWITPSCSASDTSGTRTTILHPVARRSNLGTHIPGTMGRGISQSPRSQRSQTPKGQKQPKTRGKNKGKGQGQGKDEVPGAPLPEAPWSTPNTSSTATASTAAPTQAEAQLRSIVAALKKNETNCRQSCRPSPRECQGAVTGHDQGLEFSGDEIGEGQEDTAGCKSLQIESPQCMAVVSCCQCGQVASILQRFRNPGFGIGTNGSKCHGSSQACTRRAGSVKEGGQRDHRGGERRQIGDGRGGLRRRDTGSSRQQRSAAQGGHELYAAEPRVSEKQSRHGCPGECQQKASHPCRRSRRFAALFAAGFCAARSIDQREIGYGLSCHGDVPPCVRKWIHSAVHESWFVSEWQASIDALDEVLHYGFCWSSSTCSHKGLQSGFQSISFAENLHLFWMTSSSILD